ncbi:hypothetical protein [Dysgonomonas macrotermitis]|uniref:Uncharacterized protein n=1 Tax=Dysgonomonas macrotermitis TaxID=1346286 RepID=A0A1M5HCF3_9BACT|nr:hypothetical protein [Dysgonomonas macrotermitis]SHG13623.1 hypothetical protein SAMN05444362_11622 [Dysgonomonas macrotermitis]
MGDNKKIFIIEIDGLKKAYEDISKLIEKLNTLDQQISNSKTSLLIAEVFSSSSTLLTNTNVQIENLSKAINGLTPLIDITKKLAEIQTDSNKEVGIIKTKTEKIEAINIASFAKRSEAYQSLLDGMKKGEQEYRTSLSQTIEKIEESSKKSGGEVLKYTAESKVLYMQHFETLEKLYASDAEKLKVTLAQKEEYEKKYVDRLKVVQDEMIKLIKEKDKLFDLEKVIIDAKNIKTDIIKNNDTTTNVDATRAQLEQTQEDIDNLNKSLKDSKEAADLFFTSVRGMYAEVLGDHLDSLVNLDKESAEYQALSDTQKKSLEEYKGILDLKSDYDNKYLLKKAEMHVLEEKQQATSNSVMLKGLTETLDQIGLQWSRYGSQLQTMMTNLSSFMTASKDLYTAEAAKVGEAITAIDKQLQASTEKRKALEEEAKTATGGRLIALEEQKAREIEVSKELEARKKEEATEKARLEKEAEKRDKRAKRLAIVMSIPKAVADVAAGVSKALSLGLLGIPIAAIIAAQGAIQIATVKKQLDKINLEDGGLLRGKRHSQGGMRIEGTNIEVEGDEYVVNRISTRKNLGLIEYINKERRELAPEDLTGYFSRSKGYSQPQVATRRMYEEGGQLTNLEMVGSVTAPDNDKILEAISRIDFRPVVSVVDIASAQRSVTTVQSSVGI